MVTIITARETDIPVLEDILLDAVHWLDGIGKPLWRAEQVTWARLSQDFGVSDFRIALLDGKPAACMALTDYDPVFGRILQKGNPYTNHLLECLQNSVTSVSCMRSCRILQEVFLMVIGIIYPQARR